MFHQPVQEYRFFLPNVLYKEVKWTDLKDVVQKFKTRIEDWYIKPADELRNAKWDNAFAVMAIDCLLIDALSQYYYGELQSTQTTFKKFARRKLPGMKDKLPALIKMRPERRKRRKNLNQPLKAVKKRELNTFADALYVAFRCGILHEAHIAVCGGVASIGTALADIDSDPSTIYRDGTNCPTVRMDPQVIFDELKKFFDAYIADLLNADPKYNGLRKRFKKKFRSSFGVNIKTATL